MSCSQGLFFYVMLPMQQQCSYAMSLARTCQCLCRLKVTRWDFELCGHLSVHFLLEGTCCFVLKIEAEFK